jgi:hypothetical protein
MSLGRRYVVVSVFFSLCADCYQFYIAWVVVAIIWLWISMLIAIFYPIFDGGIEQIRDVYRGLRGRKVVTEAIPRDGKGDTSTSTSAGSISDTNHVGEKQGNKPE